MRLFVGIPLPQTVVTELNRFTQGLKSPGDELRWSDPAGWHITLQFLGNTTTEQYDCVCLRLREIQVKPFEIELEAPGFFERSGVFFTGVRLSPELGNLQQRISAATEPCGFAPEERAYHPHITLARSRGGGKSLTILKERVGSDPDFTRFMAREFAIYESFPGPSGSRFEVRARFSLLATQ